MNRDRWTNFRLGRLLLAKSGRKTHARAQVVISQEFAAALKDLLTRGARRDVFIYLTGAREMYCMLALLLMTLCNMDVRG